MSVCLSAFACVLDDEETEEGERENEQHTYAGNSTQTGTSSSNICLAILLTYCAAVCIEDAG